MEYELAEHPGTMEAYKTKNNYSVFKEIYISLKLIYLKLST